MMESLNTTSPSQAREKMLDGWMPTGVVAILVSYLVLVRYLRYRNMRMICALAAPYAQRLDEMPYRVAHQILLRTSQYEFPFMFAFGTRWALVKSYSIQGGSKLLVDTRQLSSIKRVGKRTEDTASIIYEMLVPGIDSERGSKALARMNWLHRQYGARIDNDGYIFTLALFVLEPMRWIRDFEWRQPTRAERVAYYVYWREIGHRMGIKHLPATLADLEDWQSKFVEARVGFDEDNKLLADVFMEATLRHLPRQLRLHMPQILATFLEPRTREALGIQSPPAWIQSSVDTFLQIRGLIIRHVFLPRISAIAPPREPDADGRFHRERYICEPWYMRETTWTRLQRKVWGADKLIAGPEYGSKGYLPEELGPKRYEKAGREDVVREAALLRDVGKRGGAFAAACPALPY